MKKILGVMGTALVYFCIGTVLAIIVGGVSFWYSGTLDKNKLLGMLSIIYGQQQDRMLAEAKTVEDDAEQISYSEVSEARTLRGLNIDIRETAMEKALIDLRKVGQGVRTEKERFKKLQQGFEERLGTLQNVANNEQLQGVKKTLEALPPDIAKAQIKHILEADNGMEQVVAIIRAMSIEKRKSILSEFQGADEQLLGDIFREMLSGTGEHELIRETQDGLQNLDQPES